jgi:hypothetical protein
MADIADRCEARTSLRISTRHVRIAERVEGLHPGVEGLHPERRGKAEAAPCEKANQETQNAPACHVATR